MIYKTFSNLERQNDKIDYMDVVAARQSHPVSL